MIDYLIDVNLHLWINNALSAVIIYTTLILCHICATHRDAFGRTLATLYALFGTCSFVIMVFRNTGLDLTVPILIARVSLAALFIAHLARMRAGSRIT